LTEIDLTKTKASEPPETQPQISVREVPEWDWDYLAESIRERRGGKRESAIRVFDFKSNWDRVVPHLHHPEVEAALVREGFDLKAGPWVESSTDYWICELDRRANEAIEQGTAKFRWRDEEELTEAQCQAQWDRWGRFTNRFAPKPDTLEWFQCLAGCHRLAPFALELGKRMFPRGNWKLMTGAYHSVAYCTDPVGNIKILFDILLFDKMTATEIIDFATERDMAEWVSDEEIEEEYKRLLAEKEASLAE
jgi:hypothetical protein